MRTPGEIRQHYEVEKALADQLKHAPAAERGQLYGRVYDELFRRVPTHPQLTRKEDANARAAAVAERMALLRHFAMPDTVFLEIGAGDGSLSRHIATRVRKCYALDVSKEILDTASGPNLEPVLSDGCSIPIPAGTVTLAYSYQVMEHIHPDDAAQQLQNIHTTLARGGMYLCVTPNRLNGPHDVSQFFDPVAQGFHLKEYTFTELERLFRATGFSKVKAFVGFSHRYFRMPLVALKALEALLDVLPHKLRRRIGNLRGVQNLLFISIGAVK